MGINKAYLSEEDMNRLVLRDPFARGTDRLRVPLDGEYQAKFSEGLFPAQLGIPLQIQNEEDRIVVQAVVPGVSKSDINVTVSERLVCIEVSKTRHDSGGEEKGPMNEPQDVLTRRSFRLREDVEVDKCESRLENGILEVCLAKSAKSQPTKLKIMG